MGATTNITEKSLKDCINKLLELSLKYWEYSNIDSCSIYFWHKGKLMVIGNNGIEQAITSLYMKKPKMNEITLSLHLDI